ncbi:MAG: PAS domain S-box protein [Candidatus Sericytochromatia bacterium]
MTQFVESLSHSSPCTAATSEMTEQLIVKLCRQFFQQLASQLEMGAMAQFSRQFVQMPFPMWVYALGNQQFRAVNPAALRHYGYSESEFLGMTLTEIRPSEEQELLQANLQSALKTGFRQEGIWRHRQRSGELRYMQVYSQRVCFGNENAALVLALDVHEPYTSHNEQQRLQGVLEKAQQEWQIYTHLVSHQLRNPVVNIQGLVYLLQNQLFGPDEVERALACLADCAQQLDQITRDMLGGLATDSTVAFPEWPRLAS